MTDQADRPLTPLSSLEQLSNKDSRGNRSTWVDKMESKGPVRTGPFPHCCYLQTCCALSFKILTSDAFDSSPLRPVAFSDRLNPLLAGHACLPSFCVINMSSNICQYCAVLRSNAEMQPYSSKVHVTDQVIWESMHFSVKGSAAHVGELSIWTTNILCHFQRRHSVVAVQRPP